MTTLFRAIVLVFVVPAVYFFVYWVPFSLVPFEDHRWIPLVVSLGCAVAVGWYVWVKLGSSRSDLISRIALGACVMGGIGFGGGFFGPMIFAPDANQGPLLGLFITGPAGFFFGAIGGWIAWWVGRKKGMQQSKASFKEQPKNEIL